jgi:hypothetical protein
MKKKRKKEKTRNENSWTDGHTGVRDLNNKRFNPLDVVDLFFLGFAAFFHS